MDDSLFSIEGLSLEAAQQHILTILTELKLREKELKNLLEQENTWSQRLELAQKHNRDDLIQAAQTELTQIAEKKHRVRQELQEFQLGMERLKSQMNRLPGELSLQSSDQLIAELSLLVGEEPKPDDSAFDELEAQQALEKMKSENQGQ